MGLLLLMAGDCCMASYLKIYNLQAPFPHHQKTDQARNMALMYYRALNNYQNHFEVYWRRPIPSLYKEPGTRIWVFTSM